MSLPVRRTASACGAAMRNVIRRSGWTSGDVTGGGWVGRFGGWEWVVVANPTTTARNTIRVSSLTVFISQSPYGSAPCTLIYAGFCTHEHLTDAGASRRDHIIPNFAKA